MGGLVGESDIADGKLIRNTLTALEPGGVGGLVTIMRIAKLAPINPCFGHFGQ